MGFKDAEQGFLINPHPQTIIGPGDVMIVLGTLDQILNFAQHYTTRDLAELKRRR
ncbi:MAG: hypothetical protein OHK0053_09870 [Microscillaceae bacterium]